MFGNTIYSNFFESIILKDRITSNVSFCILNKCGVMVCGIGYIHLQSKISEDFSG